MANKKVKGLGMGMDALFSQNETKKQETTLRLTEIFPNKNQPRSDFDDEAIKELADSIKQHGVLQPLLVRPLPTGGYQIVAGERRWRASRMAGLEEVPVLVKELDDEQTAQLALVENLQREDLNPVEEARAFKELIDVYGYTQEEVGKIVGKSRTAVTNALRILGLDPTTLDAVRHGEISVGHAKVLAGVEDDALRAELAVKVKRDLLTVRALEDAVKTASKKKPKPVAAKENYYREVELALAENLGRSVSVSGSKGKGKLTIEFYSNDDLSAIANALARLNEK